MGRWSLLMPGFHFCLLCELTAKEAFDVPNTHWEEVTQQTLKNNNCFEAWPHCGAEAGFELTILTDAGE